MSSFQSERVMSSIYSMSDTTSLGGSYNIYMGSASFHKK